MSSRRPATPEEVRERLERARLRDMSEGAWSRQVTDLAEALGWSWAHWRPAQTKHGWRTPVQGPLGAGWPDLVLAHIHQHRVLFVELKREDGKTSNEQDVVLEWLRRSGAEVRVWRPGELHEVARDLAGQRPAELRENRA